MDLSVTPASSTAIAATTREPRSVAGPGKNASSQEILHAETKSKPAVRDEVKLSRSLDLTLGQDLLKSSIGRKIDAMFEEYGIDMDEYAGQDMSVDATSKRIFDFAIGMFDAFKKQNEGLDEEELKSKFEGVIRGAVDKGYGEAMKILEGMKLDDEVLETSRATYAALNKLFDDYFHPKEDEEQADSEAGPSADQAGNVANNAAQVPTHVDAMA